jgi:hypothetical protein
MRMNQNNTLQFLVYFPRSFERSLFLFSVSVTS